MAVRTAHNLCMVPRNDIRWTTKILQQVRGRIKAAPTARLGLPPSRLSPEFPVPGFPPRNAVSGARNPGNKLEIEIKVLKFIEDMALVEAVATVDATIVARGKLGFAWRGLLRKMRARRGLDRRGEPAS
jgi:hypothetical protein